MSLLIKNGEIVTADSRYQADIYCEHETITTIARDIADPELWTERYHCPTWLDFLRQRNRTTQSERALYLRAAGFHLGPDPVRVRRMLERPFGSVRWKEETPDRAAEEVLPVVAQAAGSST